MSYCKMDRSLPNKVWGMWVLDERYKLKYWHKTRQQSTAQFGANKCFWTPLISLTARQMGEYIHILHKRNHWTIELNYLNRFWEIMMLCLYARIYVVTSALHLCVSFLYPRLPPLPSLQKKFCTESIFSPHICRQSSSLAKKKDGFRSIMDPRETLYIFSY